MKQEKAKQEKSNRGRPIISESKERRKVFTVTLLPSVKDKVSAIAQEQDRSFSWVVNNTLEELVAKKKLKK